MKHAAPRDPAPEDPFGHLPAWFRDQEVIPLEDHLALVVSHETMRGIVALCRALAEAPAPVLLTGETGVGKSLLARFLHASRDPYAPFVSFLTAGLEARVLEARLFGEGGPARQGAAALVEEAAGGTLVLEEMGDLPASAQEGLAAFWDAQAAGKAPLGPCQWVCTTNAPYAALLAGGALRPELLRRFRHIEVPPLRERRQDIPALVAYFSRLKTSRQAALKGLEQLAARLADHPFPGNVRELESLMTLEASGLPWRWRVTRNAKGPVLDTRKARAGARTKNG